MNKYKDDFLNNLANHGDKSMILFGEYLNIFG